MIYALISRLQERPKPCKYNGKVIFVLMTVKAKQRRDIKMRDNTNEFVAGLFSLEEMSIKLWENFNPRENITRLTETQLRPCYKAVLVI